MKIHRGCIYLLTAAFVVSLAAARAEDKIINLEAPLSKPKKMSERSEGAADKVPYAVWIPDGVPVLHGAMVNPFYVKAAGQKHWQEACRQWGFVVVGANYFGVSNTEFAPSLAAALKDAGAKSGHPELERASLLFAGMSAGAGMSTQFAAQMPERTIAVGPVCLEVGPKTPESRLIPTITIFGQKDGKQMEQLLTKLPAERAEHAQWGIAPQWGRGHEYARANNLVLPYFDRAVRQRLPRAGSSDGDSKLVNLDEAKGWLGDVDSWQAPLATIGSFADYAGDKTKAAWLPDRYLAFCWRAFVAHKPALKITSPSGMGDGAAFDPFAADAPLAVTIDCQAAGDTVAAVELFDGDVPLGKAAVENGGKIPVNITIAKLERGLKALHAMGYDAAGKPVATSTLSTIVVK